VFQPVLFGLIGTEIDLSQLEENTILYGLCVLAVGLTVSIVLCWSDEFCRTVLEDGFFCVITVISNTQ
jgi:hypothetical protein